MRLGSWVSNILIYTYSNAGLRPESLNLFQIFWVTLLSNGRKSNEAAAYSRVINSNARV